jgi:hypothetical protein
MLHNIEMLPTKLVVNTNSLLRMSRHRRHSKSRSHTWRKASGSTTSLPRRGNISTLTSIDLLVVATSECGCRAGSPLWAH